MAELEKEFRHALSGREVWLKIKKKYEFTNEFGIVLFPSENQDLNTEAAALLPSYKSRAALKKVVAVTCRKSAACLLSCLAEENIEYEMLGQEEMEDLLGYYRLVSFCAHVIVVSLDKPYCEKHFLTETGITLENFVKNAIYRVR